MLKLLMWLMYFGTTENFLVVHNKEDEVKNCVQNIIENVVSIDTTILSFHGSSSRDVLPEGIQNPFVSVDASKKIVRHRSYKSYKGLVILNFQDVNFSWMFNDDLRNFGISSDNKYLIVVSLQSWNTSIKSFLYFWKRHLINLIFLAYDFDLKNDSIRLFTSDPQHPLNQCGKVLNFVEEHSCKGVQTIKFPKILRPYSDCNITYYCWLPLKQIKHQSELFFIKSFVLETVEKLKNTIPKQNKQQTRRKEGRVPRRNYTHLKGILMEVSEEGLGIEQKKAKHIEKFSEH
ncbi:hypothetical protein FQA39_LY00150 [Lamprigera yunnana]|nr:hypothetical protein FQA39_LY00150 [Lamprigera yunnana]